MVGQADKQGWVERRWAARAVGVIAFGVPFLSSVIAAFFLSSALPEATASASAMVRWLGIAVASTVVLLIVERQTRRLMPLRTLLGLTLAFPDRTPSRFRIALRTGTTGQLRKRLDQARDSKLGNTPSDAAERLLELVGMLSRHDRLTRGHSERVRAYSHLIGEEMGMTSTDLDRLRWAGLLHDVGKLAIPTAVLNKPDKLTSEEYELIKTHPMEGKELVAPLADWLGDSARAVWEHHERIDGTGYPQGLVGEQISLAARVVSVADVYDVMTSVRSYKDLSTAAEARAELARCAGTQFDSGAVKAFLSVSVSRVRSTMGPLSWFAQLSLFPQAVFAQAGPTLATTAVVATGAAAGTVGIAVSPVGPVVADEPVVAAVARYEGERQFDLSKPIDTIVVVEAQASEQIAADTIAPSDQQQSPPPSTPPATISAAPSTTIDASGPAPATAPATTTDPNVTSPASTTTTSPALTSTTTSPVATTTTTLPAATTSTTTTTTTTAPITTTTSTTTTTIPPVNFSSRLYLGTNAEGNTQSAGQLPIATTEPAVWWLYNYDTDRDSAPGLLIQKDSDGLDGDDPTKVQVFSYTFGVPSRIDAKAAVTMFVAAKDFGAKDVHVGASLVHCDAGGSCVTIATADKEKKNAMNFKKVTVKFGKIDVTFAAGDRLELRIAALDDSEDDMYLAYGTTGQDSVLKFKD